MPSEASVRRPLHKFEPYELPAELGRVYESTLEMLEGRVICDEPLTTLQVDYIDRCTDVILAKDAARRVPMLVSTYARRLGTANATEVLGQNQELRRLRDAVVAEPPDAFHPSTLDAIQEQLLITATLSHFRDHFARLHIRSCLVHQAPLRSPLAAYRYVREKSEVPAAGPDIEEWKGFISAVKALPVEQGQAVKADIARLQQLQQAELQRREEAAAAVQAGVPGPALAEAAPEPSVSDEPEVPKTPIEVHMQIITDALRGVGSQAVVNYDHAVLMANQARGEHPEHPDLAMKAAECHMARAKKDKTRLPFQRLRDFIDARNLLVEFLEIIKEQPYVAMPRYYKDRVRIIEICDRLEKEISILRRKVEE